MPKGGRRRRKKKGKKKKKDKGGAQRSKRDASADVEEKEDASAVARVFNDVALADAIMSYYFVAKPRGATDISALAMADRYWYSCHEDFVVRYPEALLCAWFESCCGRDGLFVFNRTNRAQRLYLTLEETQDSSVAHLLRGCGATCFGAGGQRRRRRRRRQQRARHVLTKHIRHAVSAGKQHGLEFCKAHDVSMDVSIHRRLESRNEKC